MSMRVQVGRFIFDADASPSICTNEDENWVVETATCDIEIPEFYADAFGHWVESGCPLPVAGEPVFEAERYAFDVVAWYQDQIDKGAVAE